LVYLPPYSPHLNPIEEAFSSVKSWLRRNEEFLSNHDDLPMLIAMAALSVTPEMAQGWFHDCGYL
ncbi:hypothetical protein EXIGLDRAFT_592922, partial [Exidia glandulosa HHB12029]